VTDTLTADPFLPPAEPELLSRDEVAPKPAPSPKTYPCPEPDCAYVGSNPAARASHKYTAHRKAKAKPAAKRPPRNPKAAAAAKASPEPSRKARKSAAENLSLLVAAGAQFAARTGHLPLANALSFEAPAAGHALDTAVAGTIVDRKIVQPLNAGAEKWEALGAVLTLPIMVHLVSLYPGLQEAFEPQIRRAAEDILVQSLPTIRKKVEKDRRVADALVELGHLDPKLAASEDPVGAIIAGFFSGFSAPEAPNEEA